MGEIVNFTFGADCRQFKQELEAMRKNCQIFIDTVGNGFAALGLDSVLDLFGKLSAAVSKLGSMFSSCMKEAAALENVGTRLGVMLNNANASWTTSSKAVPWLPSNAATAGPSCPRTAPPAWKSSQNATFSGVRRILCYMLHH